MDEAGRLVEYHGLPEDPRAERLDDEPPGDDPEDHDSDEDELFPFQ